MKINDRKHLIFIALLLIGIFIGSFRTLGDNDIWFQLLAGKYFIEHGSVPHTDFFLYVGQGNPQQFGGWGFGVMYEWVISIFGLSSATYLNSTIWCASFFFAIKAAAARSNTRFSTLTIQQLLVLDILTSIVFIASSSRMSMRAESTLVFSWTLSLWLFEKAKRRDTLMSFWLTLPLIGWAEAMLHTGGFVLLTILPICYAMSITGASSWRRNLGGWIACAIALAILPSINPNGVEQVYVQLIDIIKSMMPHSKVVVQGVNLEYLPIWDARASAMIPPYLLLVLLGVFICFNKRSRVCAVENIICVAFLVLAAIHNRGISLAAMVLMVPSFQLAFSNSFDKLRFPRLLAGCIFIVLCAVPLGGSYVVNNFGIQSAKTAYDFEIAKIRKTHPNGAHIFTTENGPALAYAFHDERFLVSKGGHPLIQNRDAEIHHSLVVNSEDGWESEMEKQHVDFVCMPLYLPLPGQGIFFWLPSMLASNSEWKSHIGSGTCNLFERIQDGNKLNENEVKFQTMTYLQNLAIFSEATFYGQPDVIGQEIGRKAKENYDKLNEELKEKASDDKKH